MKRLLRLLQQYVRRHRRALFLGGVAAVVLLLFFVDYRLFVYQKTVQFSYSGTTCFRDITPLPRLFKTPADDPYSLKTGRALTWRGYPVLATESCIVARQVPQEGSKAAVRLAVFGNPIIKKRFAVAVKQAPSVHANLSPAVLSPRTPLIAKLDQKDGVFDYYLEVGDKRSHCDKAGQLLACEVQELGLAQGTAYELRVQRYFGEEKVADVLNQPVTTTSPITIVSSSFQPGGFVYDKPTQVKLVADKPVESAEAALETLNAAGERQPVSQKITIQDKEIIVTFDQPLARDARFELTLKTATAQDKGFLDHPYVLPFTVSGGPIVTGVNIGRISVDPSASVVIDFDQNLAPGQDLTKIISFKNGGAAAAFTASTNGNKLTIRPAANLGRCSTFSVTLTNDLKSEYGISGNSGWSYSSRTVCHTISTIGYSARGRAIQAYRFGSGSVKVLYLGATHGDERSTKYLLDQWITDLEAHPEKIPANHTIIVIPSLNPDGFASDSRRNANGVDLNRNFPASNWKPNVTMPGGELIANGGGTSPLSEPESAAIASFVRSERPRLVLTYHAVASVVSANGAGDSAGLAAQYSGQSRYRNLPAGENESVFNYDTTGAFEDWLAEKEGIPALLIELGSFSGSEWSRNSAAMWTMAQL